MERIESAKALARHNHKNKMAMKKAATQSRFEHKMTGVGFYGQYKNGRLVGLHPTFRAQPHRIWPAGKIAGAHNNCAASEKHRKET